MVIIASIYWVPKCVSLYHSPVRKHFTHFAYEEIEVQRRQMTYVD